MRLLDAWHFNFTIETPEPIDGAVIDGLMWDVCVGWAEENGLGIGGSIQPAPDRNARISAYWVAGFGLERDGELTSELDATGLLAVISQWCQQHGYRLTGGFEAFPPEEDEDA